MTTSRYHWIKDAIEDGMFELNKVHTDDNTSDMLTKAVNARTLGTNLTQLYARKTRETTFGDGYQGLKMRFKAWWLLGTLPDTWETFRTSLSNSAPDGVITMELAKGEVNSRGPDNRGNHRSSSSKGKFADVECYHCHKKGHTMKFCRQLKGAQEEKLQ
ncbi:putative RNA-directed DNA polymerase [Tanacetum coccineum]